MCPIETELRKDDQVIVFRAEHGKAVTLTEVVDAMRAHFQTPGFSSAGGGVWDFRGASVELSFDEVRNLSRSLHGDLGCPRGKARAGLLVENELHRAVLIECKAVAGLETEWAFFDNIDRAIRWASRIAWSETPSNPTLDPALDPAAGPTPAPKLDPGAGPIDGDGQ